VFLCVCIAPRGARAEEDPRSVELPSLLTLDEALRIFRTRGLDLLIAEANVRSAEADTVVAGAIINPALNAGYGRALNRPAGNDPNDSSNQYTFGVSDQGALLDTLSGKRGLRKDVAQAALAAAKMSRADAQRTLEFQIKQAYVQVALATAALNFSRDVQAAANKTFELQRLRYPKVIDEGALARFEVQKLEADQQADLALQGMRTAQVALAFLLGVRGTVRSFNVEQDMMRFTVPERLVNASPEALIREAYQHRPDLKLADFQRQRAGAEIDLERRKRFPDIALSAQYTNNSVIQPPTLSFGITAPIPLLYQNQGEIRRAEADYTAQSVTRWKTQAQITSDVEGAFASYTISRRLVERMESTFLERAKRARDITELQYNAGSANLLDFIDAQRTFIATNLEYLQNLTNYWTAVFQLEQAVGTELRK